MNPALNEWLNLIVRWIHVFAGILWIGSTYFFTWLDSRFPAEEKTGPRSDKPQVWMVHSGGFYVIEKEKSPAVLPRNLRWFRWEAAITWLSGMALLFIVYYLGGVLVDDSVANISVKAGIAIGVGTLMVGWVIYDFMVRSPLGKSESGFAVVAFLLVAGITCGLTRLLSGRAAYMHVGALFGTIMAANVWMCILPAQRKMIAAIAAGQKPDGALAAQAKLRSKHNTFMVVPLVFIMVSNHFPTATYGAHYNGIILLVLILAGSLAAKFLRGV